MPTAISSARSTAVLKRKSVFRVRQRPQTCSICGRDRRTDPCPHHNGQTYGGKQCHTVLDGITDAYEWSFVAIPAQREAGVTKHFQDSSHTTARCQMLESELRESRALVRQAEELMRQDIIRLRFLVEGKTEQDAVAKAAAGMDLGELCAFRETLRTRQRRGMPYTARSIGTDADRKQGVSALTGR